MIIFVPSAIFCHIHTAKKKEFKFENKETSYIQAIYIYICIVFQKYKQNNKDITLRIIYVHEVDPELEIKMSGV